MLDLELQAAHLDAPLVRWGRERRKSRMTGTWHFYTADYRFEGLWLRPEGVVNSGCSAAAEPNFSVEPQTPRAVALWQVFRKRWLGRFWQDHGVRLWVDLNVAPEHADLAFLGVPRGWRSYCTRGSASTEAEHERAREHAGQEPRFVVYGGGRASRELARSRGWVWIPEESDAVRGRTWDEEKAPQA